MKNLGSSGPGDRVVVVPLGVLVEGPGSSVPVCSVCSLVVERLGEGALEPAVIRHPVPVCWPGVDTSSLYPRETTFSLYTSLQ